MAIQHRRANFADFDPFKMLPAEWAFPLDRGEGYYCISPGNVRRVATKEELIGILETNQEAYDGLQQLISELEDETVLTGILADISQLLDDVAINKIHITDNRTDIDTNAQDIINLDTKTMSHLANKANQLEVDATNLRIDNLVIPISPENANIEVTDARNSIVKNKNFASLKARLEESEKDSTAINSKINFDSIVLTNIEDGKFKDLVSNWYLRPGTMPSIADDTLTNEISTSQGIVSNYHIYSKKELTIPGNKYFVRAEVLVSKDTTFVLSAGDKLTDFIQVRAAEWTVISAIHTPTTAGTFNIYTNTTSFAIGDKIKYRKVMRVNLTKNFTLGKEPDLTIMNLLLTNKDENYIDGLEKCFIPTLTNMIYGSQNGVLGLFPAIELKSHLYGKKLACFGDSITGRELMEDYPSIIAKRTGMTVYNVGFGGTRAGFHSSIDYNRYSFYNLVDYIISRNFSQLDIPFEKPTAFPTREATLKSIDFNNIDYITVAYGANDWPVNIPGEGSTPEDINSYRGALRLSLRKLLEAYPHLQVLIISPFYRYFPLNEPINDSDTEILNDLYLYQYADAAKAISEEFKVPFLDAYKTLGINKYTRGQYFTETDGTHHNIRGRKAIGDKISSKLLSEF